MNAVIWLEANANLFPSSTLPLMCVCPVVRAAVLLSLASDPRQQQRPHPQPHTQPHPALQVSTGFVSEHVATSCILG